ncbi:MAG: mechanosensitive ion channel family protein [Kiritimatiellaeota bacterium]|nr:mechanosensitive ion channel family protein [Kiritimatiellota bacterium]
MNNWSEHLLALVLMGVILAFAWLCTLPLRRRRRAAEELGARGASLVMLAHLAGPLAVLLFSALAIGLACIRPLTARWLDGQMRVIMAWLDFWSWAYVIYLIEGLAVFVCKVRGRACPVPGLLLNMLRRALLLAAALGILRVVLGINISPLLASTALLTAIVGFALQGVLGNLLAGLSIHLTRSIHPADWVVVGEFEGEVIETNWRETHLRTTAGHTLILPNSKLAEAVVHNMTWPTPVRRHSLFVGASYNDAPAEVIRALLSSAAAVPEVLREPAPAAFPTEFKDFGINYELRFWTHQHQNRAPISGAVNRMIWYQFKRQGIEIPFPMSDKLLCDFMEVVSHQKRLPPDEADAARRAAELQHSDFAARLLAPGGARALLAPEDFLTLARQVRRVRYTAGETVFRQGEPGEACYVVVRGRLRGRVEHEDAAAPHEFDLGPGALLGEMSILTGLPRTASITTPEESELLEIPPAAFTWLLSLRPEIPEQLARLVADRAAQNAQAYEKLKALKNTDVAGALHRENILQRFLHLLRR